MIRLSLWKLQNAHVVDQFVCICIQQYGWLLIFIRDFVYGKIIVQTTLVHHPVRIAWIELPNTTIMWWRCRCWRSWCWHFSKASLTTLLIWKLIDFYDILVANVLLGSVNLKNVINETHLLMANTKLHLFKHKKWYSYKNNTKQITIYYTDKLELDNRALKTSVANSPCHAIARLTLAKRQKTVRYVWFFVGLVFGRQ